MTTEALRAKCNAYLSDKALDRLRKEKEDLRETVEAFDQTIREMSLDALETMAEEMGGEEWGAVAVMRYAVERYSQPEPTREEMAVAAMEKINATDSVEDAMNILRDYVRKYFEGDR